MMTEDRINFLEKAALVLAFTVCVALGVWRAPYPHNDLAPLYAGERCLLHGSDPYRGAGLLYPPSTLVAMAPLGLFNFRTAWLRWFLLNSGLLLFAVNLVVALCPGSDKRRATLLGAIFFAGSSQLLSLAQPSALAISLAAIIGYCLMRGCMLWVGVVAFALSLAVKPQMGGLLAVYWEVRGPHRRQAIAALADALVLLLCGIRGFSPLRHAGYGDGDAFRQQWRSHQRYRLLGGRRDAGSATLSAGASSSTAQCILPGTISCGTHGVVVSYAGDANYVDATSEGFTLTVTPASTATALSAPGSAIAGSSVTLTVMVRRALLR